MVFHQEWKNRQFLWLSILMGVIVLAGLWYFNANSLATGNRVPVISHPYHQLAYTKLASQGGNFVGDVYLLDVDTSEISQVTRGGETGATAWLNPQVLDIYHRPRGSVIEPYHLNVSRGTLSRADYPSRTEVDTVNPSPNAQRVIMEIIESDTWQSSGYIAVENSVGQSRLLLSLPDVTTLPQWLPDSETIVYETVSGQICVHHIDSSAQDCLDGSQLALSPAVTPQLVAYVTEINNAYQVCVAHIENYSFSHTQCYDSNNAQISNLLWRP